LWRLIKRACLRVLSRVVETLGYKIVYTKPKIVWVSMGILSNTLDSNAYSPNLVNDRNMILNSGMEIYELKDVINGDFITGSTPNYSENIIENGAVLLKTVNIYSNYLDDSKLFYISNSVHENRLKRSQLKKGDIILTVIGATDEVVGRAVVYNGYPEKANITQSLCKFGINQKYDNYYISTFINCKYGHSMILQMAASSTRRYINNADLGTLLIPIPSPEIQKYIGDKVRKAEELREEAKRLKKEAEEIFYEAIEIDKLNSKLIKVTKFSWIKENQIEDRLDLKYNSPSIITIYEHFRKYKCSLLKDEFKTISGYAFSSGDFDDMDGEKVIKIGDISDFTIDTTSLTRVKIGTKVKERIREFSCNIQDLVYAMTGATIGKVAMYIDNETVYINQRVACIKPKRNNIPTGYLLLYLNSDIGKEISYSLSTGVAQPNIALEELNNIVIPQLANNIMDKIHHNVLNSLIKHKESKQLIQEAKQDVEDLIEGNFDMSKVKANS
jgi:type I restriction enzyme S subunit